MTAPCWEGDWKRESVKRNAQRNFATIRGSPLGYIQSVSSRKASGVAAAAAADHILGSERKGSCRMRPLRVRGRGHIEGFFECADGEAEHRSALEFLIPKLIPSSAAPW